MGFSQNSPSFSCELRIIQAQNVEFNSTGKGNLFTRFYLSSGTNKRIKLNTRKISPLKSEPFWDESFSLDCLCSQEFLDTLKKESLVLEVRQSNNTTHVPWKIRRSRVLGRAEIPWKTILESPNMELKEWVKMDLEGAKSVSKPIKLQVEIRIGEPSERRNRSNTCKKWDEESHDYDLFALAATFETFEAL